MSGSGTRPSSTPSGISQRSKMNRFDQHQISPCNINAYSTHEAMRIKDMITQGQFS